MSLLDVLAGVRAKVASVVPTWDPGRRFTMRSGTDARALEESNVPRHVDVVAGVASEGPYIASGGTVRYQTAPVSIDVLYPLASYPRADELAHAMARDAADIIGAVRPPSAWSSFANSLLLYSDRVTMADVVGTGGTVVARILTIPLDAEWGN